MSKRRINNKAITGPPPRAALAMDIVMTRGGSYMLKKAWVGPNNITTEDLISIIAIAVAVTVKENVKSTANHKDVVTEITNLITIQLGLDKENNND